MGRMRCLTFHLCLLLTVAKATDHDDFRAPDKCISPGGCAPVAQAVESGLKIRLVQLLSGRDHSNITTARSSSQRSLFQQAKGMANFQYLVGDGATNEVVVFDGCWDPIGIQRFAEEKGLKLVGYVATHFHYDHIGSLAGAGSPPAAKTIPGMAYFVDELNLPAYIHEVEVDRAIAWTGTKNTSRVHTLKDGSALQLGALRLKFLHTPGHSPGGMSVILHNGADQMIITGDTLFPGSCGRVDLPDSDKKDMHRSLQTVLARQANHIVVWPGHAYSGESSTIAREKESGFLQNISIERWMQMMR